MRLLTKAQFQGFRCYEASTEIELDHVNLFVGQNNSGKSALLLAIRRLASVELQRHPRIANPAGASHWGPSTNLRLASGDLREGAAQTEFQLTVGPDAATLRGASEGITLPAHVRAVFGGLHGTVLQAADASFDPGTDSVNPVMGKAVELIARLPIVVLPEQRGLYRSTLRAPEQPDVREERVDADELLPTLLGWQCETAEKIITWRERASEVLGQDVDVQIKPREEALCINIGREGFRRVEMLGAGVTSVLIYALALTKYDGGLLLYEEPELHLHPAMQRRLVEDLYRTCTKGRWQAMVTTHSNHVIDLDKVDGISLFRVQRQNGVSSLRPIGSNAQVLREVVMDLGARPSSLLQSNAVIWVEGPSDATYLRFYLSKAAAEVGAELREGTDFSFAFFGGALLAHERLTDTPIEGALVKLLSVHANSFVVLDSDREMPDSELGKPYARQFVAACEYPDRLWVTKGREIENYLHPRVAMWAAGGQVTDLPTGFQLDDHGIFADQVTALRTQLRRNRAAHDASDSNKKVFADQAVKMMAADANTDWLDRLDLRERLHALVAFIRKCGGFNAGTSTAGSLHSVAT